MITAKEKALNTLNKMFAEFTRYEGELDDDSKVINYIEKLERQIKRSLTDKKRKIRVFSKLDPRCDALFVVDTEDSMLAIRLLDDGLDEFNRLYADGDADPKYFDEIVSGWLKEDGVQFDVRFIKLDENNEPAAGEEEKMAADYTIG